MRKKLGEKDNDSLRTVDELLEEYNKTSPVKWVSAPCPTCGVCPTCGRQVSPRITFTSTGTNLFVGGPRSDATGTPCDDYSPLRDEDPCA